jgi:hypothetical protein
MFDKQPPELLQNFYARLAQRYAAAVVRLLDIPDRWKVFRTADLTAGAERTVFDIEPPQHHTVDDMAQLLCWAAFGVGSGHDATPVVMHLAQLAMPGYDPHAAPTMPVRCGAWHAR